MLREFVNSHFLSSLQFSHFMNTSDASFSKCFFSFSQFSTKPGKVRKVIFHMIGLNLSLKFTNCTVCPPFSALLQMLPLRATDLFALQELILCHSSIQRVWKMLHSLLEPHRLCRSEILDSTFLCMRTQLQVSPRLLGNMMSLTQSFLCGSDKLVVSLHFLLSPVGTVVKPAYPFIADRPNPIQEGVNHKSTSRSVCGRISV